MSNDQISRGYAFEVLNEDVAGVDLFEDQTHAHVSKNLFNLIKSTKKGATIGLEGGWGSGKSTVINLLSGELSKDKSEKTIFFMFDAWAHDGDPLRRIFLESFIQTIRDTYPSNDDNKLTAILNQITGRKKVVNITAKKSTSRLGKYLTVSALFIPFGSALLGKVKLEKISTSFSQLINGVTSPYWSFIIGLIFNLLPIFVIAYWLIWGDEAEGKEKLWFFQRKSWDFFQTESTENSTQDITEDGERTSIEFQSFFEQITLHALNHCGVERIVLVIDNLDRVDPQHAKNIWSTLQTFFQKRSKSVSCQAEDWEKKLWFIIPFDRAGFMKIWSANSSSEDAGTNSISSSFLKKCFQIIAQVPSPVLSAWPAYLNKNINFALASWPQKEQEIVFETFRKFASKLDESPTPRDIKVAINQIGLLGMRWGGIMSTEAICLYAQYRQTFGESEFRSALLSSELPGSYVSDSDVTDLKMELAGMLFGVEKKKGAQLLLGPILKRKMQEGDGAAIATLEEDNGHAFWIVWESVRNDFLPQPGHEPKYIVAVVAAIYGGLISKRSKIGVEITRTLTAWKQSVNSWDFDAIDYSIPTYELAKLSNNEIEVFNWSVGIYERESKVFVKEIDSNKITERAFKNFEKFRNVLIENGCKLETVSHDGLDSTKWIVWLDKLNKSGVSLPEILPGKDAISKISVNTFASLGSIDKTSLKALYQTFSVVPLSNEWEDVSRNIIAWIAFPQREQNIHEIYQLILMIVGNCKTSIVNSVVEALKNIEFWSVSKQEDFGSQIYLPMLAAIAFGKDVLDEDVVGPYVRKYWCDEKNDNQVEEAYKTLNYAKQGLVIWRMARDEENALAWQIISRYGKGELSSYPTGLIYIADYSFLDDDELRDIVSDLCEFGGFDSLLPKIAEDPAKYHLCIYAVSMYGSNSAKAKIRTILSDLSREVWDKSFNEPNKLLQCGEAFGYKYTEAFKKYFFSALEGAKISDLNWSRFDELIDKISDKAIFQEEFVKKFLETEGDNLVGSSFTAIKKHLNIGINKVDATKLMQKLCQWIDKDDREKIDWLLSTEFSMSISPLEGLEERVNEKLRSTTEQEVKDRLGSVVKKFGLTIRPQLSDQSVEENQPG